MADETTSNLKIPLLTGAFLVNKTRINDAFKAIDGNVLPLAHAQSGGHWATWAAGKNFAAGDVIRTDDCYSWGFLQCTTAGTSGALAPGCPYGEGDTVQDGSAIWTLCRIKESITRHEDLTGRNLPDQHPIAAISGLQTALDAKEDTANKGQPDGYPSLDANGHIPVTQLPPNIKEIRVVADIAARDAITGDSLYDGLRVHVLDASGDPTVTSGWAEYVYDGTNQAWVKIAEKESMDVVLDWSNLQDIPALIKALTDMNGKLAYNGTPVFEDVRSVTFIGADAEVIYPWSGTVQKVCISCSEARDADFVFNVEKEAKADFVAQADNWQLIGGAQFTLPAGEVYKECAVVDAIQAGDVLRASTVGDDTGISFQVIIQNQ